MKKSLVLVLALVMVIGLCTGIVSAGIGDAVFSWDCSSLGGAEWGAWAYGATATDDNNIIIRPADNAGDTGYAAYYMWTGNLKEEGAEENVYAVEYGKTYILNFKAKGEAGKEVQYDFKDGSIGMNGAYTFETTGEWEDVWSAPMTVTVDHELDLAPGDQSILNGYPVRIYLHPNGNPLAASEVTVDDIVIYEYTEDVIIETPEGEDGEGEQLEGEITTDEEGNEVVVDKEGNVIGKVEKDEEGNTVIVDEKGEVIGGATKNPATSDNMVIGVVVALMAISAVAIVVVKKSVLSK